MAHMTINKTVARQAQIFLTVFVGIAECRASE